MCWKRFTYWLFRQELWKYDCTAIFPKILSVLFRTPIHENWLNLQIHLKSYELLKTLVRIFRGIENLMHLHRFSNNLYQGSNWGGTMGFVSPNCRDFEKCVTEQISKNTLSGEGFLDFFRHFMHSCAMKSSTFTKLVDFLLRYRNFSKFSAPMAPKMCHLTQFFQKLSKSSHFLASSAPKNVSLNVKLPPFPLAVASPPMRALIHINMNVT